LPAEERSHLKARILHTHEAPLAEAQQAAGIAKLPLLEPDAVKKREWVKKRTHGKADARGLTGAEIAGRALKAQERKERATLNTPCPAGPSQGDCIQMHHTPNLQPSLLPPLASRSPSPDALQLPPSTAPARLWHGWGEVEGKRKRKIREAYYNARDAGLPSLGYSQ